MCCIFSWCCPPKDQSDYVQHKAPSEHDPLVNGGLPRTQTTAYQAVDGRKTPPPSHLSQSPKTPPADIGGTGTYEGRGQVSTIRNGYGANDKV